MPPLKHIKHEKFAKAVIEKPTYKEAYLAAYDPKGDRLISPATAGSNASELLRKPEVTNRIAELLNRDGISLDRLNGKLRDLLEGQSEEIQFKATKLGYELHGVLNPDKSNGESSSPILIQVNITGANGEQTAVTI